VDFQLLFITLVIKLAVATAIASALGRSKEFKKLLFRSHRNLRQTLYFVLFTGFPFAFGVYIRRNVPSFRAADLGFEGAVLIGIMGGRVAGILGGVLLALPALFYGEYLTLPVNVLAGLLAGVLRHFCRNEEEIWTFSPFIDLSVYRWVKRHLRDPRIDWQTAFFLIIIALQIVRLEVQYAAPRYLFALPLPSSWAMLVDFAFVVATISIPIKIWNNARIEMKLEEQERLLLQARLDALQSQINPHFLFNTLNSISSLIRIDPDMARELILKLSKILRRLLAKHGEFVPLQEEIEFIDAYLDIEVVRFGPDKLRVHKLLDPETLDIVIPSMILQPLVENSIKHGLSRKVDGGSITVRSRIRDNRLLIQVEDDGVGMSTPQATGVARTGSGRGIGMANVAERLQVLFGDEGKMTVQSSEGQGTLIALEMPVLHAAPLGENASAIQAVRSNMRS